jgi:methionyl-tRNA formyltransferase
VNRGAAGTVQDESRASYEGWCRDAEAHINWHNHLDLIYNLIRGCDPAPAAWTTFNGKKLQLHAARKHPARTFGEVKGAIGAVTAIGEQSVFVAAQGGQIEITKLRYDGGKKLPAPQVCAEAGMSLGAILGG